MPTIHTIAGGGDLPLHVREWGNPRGKQLFLIHGWAQSHLCWSKQFDSELAREFRIIALDIRGHGMSAAPLEVDHYNQTELWAADVKAVMDTLNLQRPVLAGWSYGGLIIGDYIRTYGTGSLGGINFVGAAPALNESTLGTLIGPGFYENFEAATSPDMPTNIAGITKFLHDCFEIPPSAEEFHTMLAFNAMVHPSVRANIAARDLDNKDVLKKIDIPVLMSHGDKDCIVLPAAGDYIMEHCPSAKASWYEGIGHAPFFEDPKRFNQELAAFANDLQ